MSVIIPNSHLVTGLKIGRREHQGKWHVYLEIHPGKSYGIPWQKADEIAAYIETERNTEIVQDIITIRIVNDIYLIPNLKTADNDNGLAHHLWAGLIAKARECEEQEKAPTIALDAAILHRGGLPFGLSNDPKIKAAALHEAQHNEHLRRVQVDNIKSAEVIGAPTIICKPPRGEPS